MEERGDNREPAARDPNPEPTFQPIPQEPKVFPGVAGVPSFERGHPTVSKEFWAASLLGR